MNNIVPIEESRQKIDAIDREMIRLFCERMAVSGDIARYKKEKRLPVYVPEREEALLTKIRELSEPDFSAYSEMLYREILSLSKKYQSEITDPEGDG